MQSPAFSRRDLDPPHLLFTSYEHLRKKVQNVRWFRNDPEAVHSALSKNAKRKKEKEMKSA